MQGDFRPAAPQQKRRLAVGFQNISPGVAEGLIRIRHLHQMKKQDFPALRKRTVVERDQRNGLRNGGFVNLKDLPFQRAASGQRFGPRRDDPESFLLRIKNQFSG